MHPIALTRSSIILPIMAFLRRIGAPVERHLARCGLPAWISTDPEALIPTSGVVRLLNEAARSEGIDDLGLRAGLEAPVDAFGFLGRRVSRLPTLRQLLHVALRHHSAFSSSGRMWVDSQGEQVRVCLAFTACFDGDWQQADHYVLMLILGLLRLGAGATWRPAAVQLQTIECDAVSNFEPLSTARINFAQPVTAVTFPRMLLDATLQPPRGDAGALDQGVDAWQASAPADDFIGSIFQVIQTLSRDGYPNTQQTADVLGLGVRSFQRHLASAGVTHEALVRRVRLATAVALLKETNARVLDIALDLGYSDHAHFTRAFRRWTGRSPQDFRRQYQASCDRGQTDRSKPSPGSTHPIPHRHGTGDSWGGA